MARGDAPPKAPPERHATPRERVRKALAAGDTHTLRELSGAASVSIGDLPDHLEHLERSLRREGLKLRVVPPDCLACGFVFRQRSRWTRPGRCPQCRGGRIRPGRVGLR